MCFLQYCVPSERVICRAAWGQDEKWGSNKSPATNPPNTQLRPYILLRLTEAFLCQSLHKHSAALNCCRGAKQTCTSGLAKPSRRNCRLILFKLQKNKLLTQRKYRVHAESISGMCEWRVRACSGTCGRTPWGNTHIRAGIRTRRQQATASGSGWAWWRRGDSDVGEFEVTSFHLLFSLCGCHNKVRFC